MEQFEKSFIDLCVTTQKIAQKVSDGEGNLSFSTCAANMLSIYKKTSNPPFFMRLFRDFFHEHKMNLLSPLYEGANPNPNMKWLKEFERKKKRNGDMEQEHSGIVLYFLKGKPQHYHRCFQFSEIYVAACKYYARLREKGEVTPLPFQFLAAMYKCVRFSLDGELLQEEGVVTDFDKSQLSGTIAEIEEQIEVLSSGSDKPKEGGNFLNKFFNTAKKALNPENFDTEKITSAIKNFVPGEIADSLGSVINTAKGIYENSEGSFLDKMMKVKDDPSLQKTLDGAKSIAMDKIGEMAGQYGLGDIAKLLIPTESVDVTGGSGAVDASEQE